MKRLLIFFLMFISSFTPAMAEVSASADFNITLPKFIRIESVLSPVLIANITNRSGNLHAPLHTRFKVISNSAQAQTLYLKSHIATDSGMENSMFIRGGNVYVAFGNLAKLPSYQALVNCKKGGSPNDSAGVVAFPITSVSGVKNKYTNEKYEVYINNGISYVDVNIGSQVLKESFGSNDKNGFYQAILSLTEADI